MPTQKLQQYLSPLGVFALAFGCAVGWGAFIMPATVFLPIGGPLGVAVGMTIGGLIMLIIGYNYYYMMRRHHDAGGTYAFSKFTFGHDHGFIASWFLLLVFIAITWANVTALVLIFRNLAGDIFQFGFHYTIAGYHIYAGEILTEIAAILLFGALAIYKKTLAVKLQILMVFIMLVGITAGFAATLSANGTYLFEIKPYFSINHSPALSVLGIIVLAPWAFAGFESVSNSAEEFKFSTKKTFTVMVFAIILGIYSYVALSYLAISASPYAFGSWPAYFNSLPELKGIYALPVFHAVYRFLGENGLTLLGVTLFSAAMTGLLGNTIGGSRLVYAMARDNLLPRWFKRLTEDGSPRNTILFIMLISLPIPFFGRTAISWIIDVNTIGTTIAYAYTSAAALKAAIVDHNKKVTVTGAAGLLISVFFFLYFIVPWNFSTANLAVESYFMLIVWSILGFAVYRYIFKRDRARRFGKSTVAWIALLAMIFLSSMLWMRESVKDNVNEAITAINKHHLAELKAYGVRLNKNEEKQVTEFVGTNLEELENSLAFHNILQIIVLAISLYIMFNIYSLMMARERKTELERTLLQKENVAKSTFFFNMSHDIRTPMNAIIGYVNLLKKEDLDDKTKDYLSKIETASDNLLSLINDILEVSRIENNKFTLEITATNIKNCIMEVKDLFKTQMEGKNLKYTVETDIKNEWVAADGKRLNRVLLNLISNSYKFTPKGGAVAVTISEITKEEYLARTGAYYYNKSAKDEDEGENSNVIIDPDLKLSDKKAYYELRVRDMGIGMSDEFAATVFDAYARDRSVSNIQGTGLGMSITKSIIDMMDGAVRVETKTGKGTTFIIHLAFPLVEGKRESAERESAERESAERESAVDLKGLRVLLAEDVEMNREIAVMILSEFDMQVETAENGKIALEKVIESEDNPFDLVLMDIQMPEMNGYETTKAIRALESEKLKNIPIIAMTANAFKEDVETALAAGMNAHIAKPLDVDKMFKTIEEVLG
ncbi:MAG: amino acid permease [Selenomonadaceae bacterium]|nr:amino acid permease [Selenomonadaceae bacterium]